MKEMVDLILKEEGIARNKVEKAKKEAEDIMLEVKKSSQAVYDDIIRSAKNEVEAQKEGLNKELASARESVLGEAKQNISRLKGDRENKIPGLAAAMFKRVADISDL